LFYVLVEIVKDQRGVVQIIHAKFCHLVSDDSQRDSQNVFITNEGEVSEGVDMLTL
jgi:hypothetical protein